jgi:hypothetical protein
VLIPHDSDIFTHSYAYCGLKVKPFPLPINGLGLNVLLLRFEHIPEDGSERSESGMNNVR